MATTLRFGKSLRRATLGVAFLGLATFAGSSASAAIIDDFTSGTLAPYTQTTVLDNDAVRNTTFSAASGGLVATGTANVPAEQTLLLRSDFSLAVGQQLRADVTGFGTGKFQDIGIALATTATPAGVAAGATGDTRASTQYIFSGIRSDAGHAVASGFASGTGGTTPTLQDQTNNGDPITSLFISRTGVSTFAVGFRKAGGDVTLGTYTLTATTVGGAVGFYTDVRTNASTLGTLDNLSITNLPEPTTLAAIAGLGGVALRRRRRA